jgi:hypothetical protein
MNAGYNYVNMKKSKPSLFEKCIFTDNFTTQSVKKIYVPTSTGIKKCRCLSA